MGCRRGRHLAGPRQGIERRVRGAAADRRARGRHDRLRGGLALYAAHAASGRVADVLVLFWRLVAAQFCLGIPASRTTCSNLATSARTLASNSSGVEATG